MLKISDEFSSEWVGIQSPCFFLSDFLFELEKMNISYWHSNSKFAQHIVIHWSLFKVCIESVHDNLHQREIICDKLIFFGDEVKRVSKIWLNDAFHNSLFVSFPRIWSTLPNAVSSEIVFNLFSFSTYINYFLFIFNLLVCFFFFPFLFEIFIASAWFSATL